MIACDGVTRTEPEMMPPMLIDPWDPEDRFISLRRVERGGRGRWPVLLATSLAFVPIYALAVFGLTLLRL